VIAGEQIDATVSALRRTAANQRDEQGWTWAAVVVEELAKGDVYEVRLRFGASGPIPGDTSWPWVARVRRERVLAVPNLWISEGRDARPPRRVRRAERRSDSRKGERT
jgi:hypothetical protein